MHGEMMIDEGQNLLLAGNVLNNIYDSLMLMYLIYLTRSKTNLIISRDRFLFIAKILCEGVCVSSR